MALPFSSGMSKLFGRRKTKPQATTPDEAAETATPAMNEEVEPAVQSIHEDAEYHARALDDDAHSPAPATNGADILPPAHDVAQSQAPATHFQNAIAGATHAMQLYRSGDTAAALHVFEHLQAAFGGESAAYLGQVTILRETGDIKAAEKLAAVALEKFPEHAIAWTEAALLASSRHDWPEAARLWQGVIARSPDAQGAYSGAARALHAMRAIDAAKTLIAEAVNRFPDNPVLAADQARFISQSGDARAATEAWEKVRSRFPNDPSACAGLARALQSEGRLDDCDDLLSKAIATWPDNVEILASYAQVAQDRSDWNAAVYRWDALRARQPHHLGSYIFGAAALTALGRFDEADELAAHGMHLAPANQMVHATYARVATARNDWPQAVRRWSAAVQRFPERQDFLNALERARGHMAELDPRRQA